MVRCDLQGENLEIYISGDLGTKEAFNLRKGIMNYLNKGAKNISVDLRELKNIDSTGLGVLVSANKLANKNNGKVYIKGVNNNIRKIFQLTRLDKVFKIKAG